MTHLCATTNEDIGYFFGSHRGHGLVAKFFVACRKFHTSPTLDQEPWSEILPEPKACDHLGKAFRDVCEMAGIEVEDKIPHLSGLRGGGCFPSLNASLSCSPEVKCLLWILSGAPTRASARCESALPREMFSSAAGATGPRTTPFATAKIISTCGSKESKPRLHRTILIHFDVLDLCHPDGFPTGGVTDACGLCLEVAPFVWGLKGKAGGEGWFPGVVWLS